MPTEKQLPLPCPFCGSAPIEADRSIVCENVHCWGPRLEYRCHRAEAVRAWNTRASLGGVPLASGISEDAPLPCQFCGEEPVPEQMAPYDPTLSCMLYSCQSETCPARPRTGGIDRRRAIQNWNTFMHKLRRPMASITVEGRHILEHATGWRSKEPLYRNRYCIAPDCDGWDTVQRLVEQGLMELRMEPVEGIFPLHVFAVTDAGVAALRGETEP